jgi:hypothetical protein
MVLSKYCGLSKVNQKINIVVSDFLNYIIFLIILPQLLDGTVIVKTTPTVRSTIRKTKNRITKNGVFSFELICFFSDSFVKKLRLI